jgi:hypothetical protein
MFSRPPTDDAMIVACAVSPLTVAKNSCRYSVLTPTFGRVETRASAIRRHADYASNWISLQAAFQNIEPCVRGGIEPYGSTR